MGNPATDRNANGPSRVAHVKLTVALWSPGGFSLSFSLFLLAELASTFDGHDLPSRGTSTDVTCRNKVP